MFWLWSPTVCFKIEVLSVGSHSPPELKFCGLQKQWKPLYRGWQIIMTIINGTELFDCCKKKIDLGDHLWHPLLVRNYFKRGRQIHRFFNSLKCFVEVCSGPFGYSGGYPFNDEAFAGGRNITAIKIKTGRQMNSIQVSKSLDLLCCRV